MGVPGLKGQRLRNPETRQFPGLVHVNGAKDMLPPLTARLGMDSWQPPDTSFKIDVWGREVRYTDLCGTFV